MKILLAFLLLAWPWLPEAYGQAAPGLDAYQAAIERELTGVELRGQIEVQLTPDGRAIVTYHREDGPPVSRTVELPPRYADAIELVALLAANLVREQAAAIAPAPPATAPTPPSAPTPAPAAAPAPAPATTAKPAAPRVVPVTMSLFGPVATDRLYDGAVVPRLGLHLAVGTGIGARGVSLAGAVDLQSGPVHGAQLAGAAALTTSFRGAQLAGAVAAAETFRGTQLAGAMSLAETFRGAQLAGAVAAAETFRGAQLAGAVAIAERADGLQLAGAATLAEDLHGVQLSVVNMAGRMRGLQLGIINYAERSEGLSLGLINIVRNGLVELDASIDAAGLSELRLRHGTPRLYSLYLGATTLDRSVWGGGLGLGTRLHRNAGLTLDLETTVLQLRGQDIHSDLAILARPQLSAALALGAVALWGAVGANVLVGGAGETGEALAPHNDREWMSGEVTTRLWPSVAVGVRAHLR